MSIDSEVHRVKVRDLHNNITRLEVRLAAMTAERDRLQPGPLFEAIRHGDFEHQEWLAQALQDYWAGRIPQAPKGLGNKEVLIAERDAILADLRIMFAALNKPDDVDFWCFQGSAEVHGLDEAMDRLHARVAEALKPLK